MKDKQHPSWSNAELYPDPLNATMIQWAWEFLRRNPKYVMDYKEYSGGPIYKNLSEYLIDFDKIMSNEAPLTKYWAVNNKTYPGEYLLDVISRLKKTCTLTSIYETIAERYKFFYHPTSLPDPSTDFANLNKFFSFKSLQMKFIEGWMLDGKNIVQEKLDRDVKRNQVAVYFDLDFPIKSQLEQANEWLQADRKMYLQKYSITQAVIPKNTKKMFPVYLMVLDAEVAGVSKPEIAKELLPNEPDSYPDYQGRKKINNWLCAARKIRDGGYLTITRT